jgi:hypothetical protein
MATPAVAGLAALLFGQDPSRTPDDVKVILARSADKVGDVRYRADSFGLCRGCTRHPKYGYGRINVRRALGGPDFTLTASPASRAVKRGTSTSYALTVAGASGFAATVAPTVTGLPPGSRLSFSPNPVTQASILRIRVPKGTERGIYPLAVSATGDVETGPADDVGHEGIAGHEATTGKSNWEGAEVETVTLAGPSLGEVAFEDCFETPLAEALDGAVLVRKRQAARELAQQREQRQIGPRGRLEPVCFRLRDGDRLASDCGSQSWLELTEGDLPLHDSAQVVLIEVEENRHLRRRRRTRSAASRKDRSASRCTA